MNDNREIRDPGSSAVMGFMIGALVGAGVALLLAPQSGSETRERIADAGRGLGDAARTKLGEFGHAANDLKQDAKTALEAGRTAFEQGRKSHESPSSPRTEPKS